MPAVVVSRDGSSVVAALMKDVNGGGSGITDAPDSKNYARTQGKWVDLSTLIPSKAAAVADLAGDADIAAVVASYNTLLKNLRAAGLLAS